jgi:hypothetical protein
MVDGDDGYEGDDQAGCGPCARGGGLLLLAVGLGLGLIGADLLTGGALTRLVTGGGAAVIAGASAASALADDDDDEGDDDGEAGEAGEGPWTVDEAELARA